MWYCSGLPGLYQKRNLPCAVVMDTGETWALLGPPINHKENPTFGLPGQWRPGYYHFRSSGSPRDRKYERNEGCVELPISRCRVVFRGEPGYEKLLMDSTNQEYESLFPKGMPHERESH